MSNSRWGLNNNNNRARSADSAQNIFLFARTKGFLYQREEFYWTFWQMANKLTLKTLRCLEGDTGGSTVELKSSLLQVRTTCLIAHTTYPHNLSVFPEKVRCVREVFSFWRSLCNWHINNKPMEETSAARHERVCCYCCCCSRERTSWRTDISRTANDAAKSRLRDPGEVVLVAFVKRWSPEVRIRKEKEESVCEFWKELLRVVVTEKEQLQHEFPRRFEPDFCQNVFKSDSSVLATLLYVQYLLK